MATVTKSTLEYSVQLDGSRSVVEWHTVGNMRYPIVYMADAKMDLEARMADNAKRLAAELTAIEEAPEVDRVEEKVKALIAEMEVSKADATLLAQAKTLESALASAKVGG